MCEKQGTSTFSHHRRVKEAEFDLLCQLRPHPQSPPSLRMGPLPPPMTSADSLSLILRRLDEIERKLDRVLQELQTLNTPAAIGYSVRRGNLPRKE